MNYCKKLKNEKGITLIALIITVIVLIIITAVTIREFSDDSEIIAKTRNATKNYNKSVIEEENVLKQLNIDTLANTTGWEYNAEKEIVSKDTTTLKIRRLC